MDGRFLHDYYCLVKAHEARTERWRNYWLDKLEAA